MSVLRLNAHSKSAVLVGERSPIVGIAVADLGARKRHAHLAQRAVAAHLDHVVARAFADPSFVELIEVHDAVDALVDRVSARLYRRTLDGS